MTWARIFNPRTVQFSKISPEKRRCQDLKQGWNWNNWKSYLEYLKIRKAKARQSHIARRRKTRKKKVKWNELEFLTNAKSNPREYFSGKKTILKVWQKARPGIFQKHIKRFTGGFWGRIRGCGTLVKARGWAKKWKMTSARIFNKRTVQFERIPRVNYKCEDLTED